MDYSTNSSFWQCITKCPSISCTVKFFYIQMLVRNLNMCCSTTKNLIYPLVSSMSIRVSLSFNSFISPIFKFPGNMNMYFIEYLTSGKYNAYRKGNNSGVCIMYIYTIQYTLFEKLFSRLAASSCSVISHWHVCDRSQRKCLIY